MTNADHLLSSTFLCNYTRCIDLLNKLVKTINYPT